MPTDAELLQRYARSRDERAFTELVQRHFDLVYAAALRRSGGRTHLAAEAAQNVFVALARKAHPLSRHPTLVGWLYQSTGYAVKTALRNESRRQKLNDSLHTMPEAASAAGSQVEWEQLRPVLDQAIDELKDSDREVMLLRYFKGLSFAEVGHRLHLAENTARMRHERALEKLRRALGRRGLTSTSAALSLLLANASIASTPIGLAAQVTTTALASTPAIAGPALLATLFMHKLTTPVIVTALGAALSVGVISQQRTINDLQNAIATLNTDRDAQTRKIGELTRLMSDLLELESSPTTPPTTAASASTAPAAVTPAQEPDIPGITQKAPAGWRKNGSRTEAYVVGVDRVNTLGGMPSAYVKSTQPNDGFGGMMQMAEATSYHGKRVRLSGWVKTENANDGGGHLWMRIDGKPRSAPLQFDNMDGRAVMGTTSWQQYSVVLDVPAEATALAYGFFLQGTGHMWVSGTKLEEVPSTVPSTDRTSQPQTAVQLPPKPSNLSFE